MPPSPRRCGRCGRDECATSQSARRHGLRGAPRHRLTGVERGKVSFVGAGPGAPDLITLRGARRIAEADVVIWAASLVMAECVTEHARPDARLVDSSQIAHEDVLALYRRAAADGLKVARVHSGDPSLWGAVQEQYDAAEALGLEVEIVPGVSAFGAVAAVAGGEPTIPGGGPGGGEPPRHGTTMAVFLSAARTGQLVDELRAGGYADDTPVVIGYRVTWPDEQVVRCRLDEVVAVCRERKLWRQTLFLVGP